jgi:ribosomal-protein-alanine N-acetyltransferase
MAAGDVGLDAIDREEAVAKGGRIFLRYPCNADEAELLALRRRNREHLLPWEPNLPRGQDACGPEWFRRFISTAHGADQARYLVCLNKQGTPIGQVSLSGVCRGPLQSAYLGYWIVRDHEGKGLMYEAVRLALRRAFQHMKLHRVEANIQPDNIRSAALIRRCGFREEGFSPRYLKIAGHWRDHVRWAILREEFEQP